MRQAIRFWTAAGFRLASAPAALEGTSVWLESAGTQIHLIVVDEPVVPRRGHSAIVANDLETTVADLRAAGFEVEPKRDLWGAARAGTTAPGGHLVELMAEVPDAQVS